VAAPEAVLLIDAAKIFQWRLFVQGFLAKGKSFSRIPRRKRKDAKAGQV
jgi:hypothetical protein